ncbi:MAG: hypothetical protein KF744_11495 [Taibaiella sp.]|nr:hypothetical protein [Taibaiella sp.]
MSNTPTNEAPSAYATRMLDSGVPRQQIENDLVTMGQSRQFATDIVAELVKMRDAKKRSQGLMLILAGAFICFISFLLTVTGFVSGDAYNFVLFGVTSLGVIVIFAGFTMVF